MPPPPARPPEMDQLIPFVQQNLFLALIFAGLTVALVVTEVRRLFRGYKTVSPNQLTELINRENALVRDLRGQSDFEKGHILGSRHLLPSQVDPESKLLAKAKEAPVVLVCAMGVSAGGVAEKLVKAGYRRVAVLDGGINAWTGAGPPPANGRGRAGPPGPQRAIIPPFPRIYPGVAEMAEQNNGAAGAEQQAQFTIQKIYVKDVSFEVPGAPQAFSETGQPQLDLNLNQKVARVSDDLFEVVLGVTLTCKVGEKTIYLAEVAQTGLFQLAGFDDRTLDMMLGTYCPNVL